MKTTHRFGILLGLLLFALLLGACTAQPDAAAAEAPAGTPTVLPPPYME